MQNTKDKIYFNFSYKALKLLGDGLYSNPWTAISELVANGIDAEATKIFIHINMIDKKCSTIEIFDNGNGMNYDDLAEKYALIGKNKRFDVDLKPVRKNKVMGRKGIGKLAALYLSSKYFLISKTNKNINCWCVDMTNITDDDIPNMKREKTVQIEAFTHWNKCITGTLIKLINVDLRNIGEQTIEALKARIADYYSFENVSVKVFVSLLKKNTDNISFKIVEKQIAYKNLYAFYNNTNIDFKEKLSKTVLISTSIPGRIKKDDVYYKRCPVIILNKDYITSGESKFIQEDGQESKELYKFEMRGWIGIHSTIEKNEAKHNDEVYIKNKAYQPNRLRLYVRNKLAVENFMNYMKNTQAFGKYIEGEIHFDILDTNDLPDIATANRQEYKENNDRIQKLIDILGPIINALIRGRSLTGTRIRQEEREYWEAKEAEEAAKREKAEHEARRAEEARQEAEEKYQQAEDARQKYEEEVITRKQQTYFLEAALTVDDRTKNYNTHIIKGNAEDIAKSLESISKKYPKLKKELEFQSITYAINKIIMTARNFSYINYDFKRTIENDDLGYFIEQYFKSIPKDEYINIEIINTSNSYIRFPYQNITMMLYNIMNNSKKAMATELKIIMRNVENYLYLEFIDNGKGIDDDIDVNSLFDFGLSHTEGTGIGLAQIKDIIENELNGTVTIIKNKIKGITLEVVIPNENKI